MFVYNVNVFNANWHELRTNYYRIYYFLIRYKFVQIRVNKKYFCSLQTNRRRTEACHIMAYCLDATDKHVVLRAYFDSSEEYGYDSRPDVRYRQEMA